MKYRLRKSALLLLLSSVSPLVAPHPALAGNVCEMSDGFIDKGIGGTGEKPQQPQDGTNTSTSPKGIGGTGATPEPSSGRKGIGGTGILALVSGIIYKHGSICVNGIRITYDANTPVKLNGQQATPDALKLGQQVEILATPSGRSGELVAQSVKIDYALQGPIESIDRATSSLRVLGERMQIPELNAQWDKMKIGEHVQISGLRDTAGRLQVSSLTFTSITADETVKGPVRVSSDGQIFVGFTPVAASTETESLKNGDTARVTGIWSGLTLKANEVQIEEPPALDKFHYISVEGYWANQATQPRIGAYSLPTQDLSKIEKGQRVIFSGYLDPANKIEPQTIHLTPAQQPFVNPPALNSLPATPTAEKAPTKKEDGHETRPNPTMPAAAAVVAGSAQSKDDEATESSKSFPSPKAGEDATSDETTSDTEETETESPQGTTENATEDAADDNAGASGGGADDSHDDGASSDNTETESDPADSSETSDDTGASETSDATDSAESDVASASSDNADSPDGEDSSDSSDHEESHGEED